MYRNVYYNPYKGAVTLWTWDENGKRVSREFPYEPYIYLETTSNSNVDATSIYNTPLYKHTFKNQWDRKKYIELSGINRIFYNLPVEQQFLIDTFKFENSNKDFAQYPLKIFMFDIETYSPNGFPDPNIAPDPINVITLYDTIHKKFYSWGIGEYDAKDRDNVIYCNCKNEVELLQKFIAYWTSDYPDIVTGWYSDGFDIPYIITRIKIILGDDYANKLSPVGTLYCQENAIQSFGKARNKWYINGITHLDYKDVYIKYTKDKKERYSLDFIGEDELGENKVYVPNSNLAKFSEDDWQSFCDYNIQDVNILVKLEEKLHYLDITRKLSYIGYTTFDRSLGTISIVTGAICLKSLEEGLIYPTFTNVTTTNYEGGFVRDPIVGLHDSIVSFDANSLYPNTIISGNISTETKIGKIIEENDNNISIRLRNGKIYDLSKESFKKFIEKENIAVTKANVLYSQNKMGICPKLLDGIYSERLQNQKLIKKHKKCLQQCNVDSDKYNEHKKYINELDIMQYTLKIFMNSVYGTFGTKYSPLYDIDNAASITLTGQACIKHASDIVNNFIEKKYGLKYDSTVYGDTDSIYITIAPILKKLNVSLVDSDEVVTTDTLSIATELENEINTKITKWAKSECNFNDSRFVFKRETICNSGLFMKKKKYVLDVVDKEGFKPSDDDRIKYIGVKVVSINVPKNVKPLIKDVFNVMMRTRNFNKTNEAYKLAYDKYLCLNVEDIATPSGINKYEKYEALSDNFDTQKGTPYHVKGAILYNKLLEKLGLVNRYEAISSGDDIKHFYTKKNKFGINGICFKIEFPKEFNIEVDKQKMFNKNVAPIIESLYNTVGWNVIKPTEELGCDLFDLLT